MSDRRHRWADPRHFFKRRCRKATHHSEWTAGAILYAHYRRWALLSDCEPVSVGNFYSRLNERLGKRRREQHGFDLWPLWVKPAPRAVAAAKPTKPAAPVRRGRVIAARDARFCDGLLAAGTELDWMEPTAAERHQLDLEYRRQQDAGVAAPQSWLVVVFSGRRRRVPADSVTKVI